MFFSGIINLEKCRQLQNIGEIVVIDIINQSTVHRNLSGNCVSQLVSFKLMV